MPTTLTEHFTQKVDALAARQNAIAADLTDTRTSHAEKKAQLEFWLERVEGFGAAIQRTQQEMSDSQTPADLEALAVKQRDLRIEERAALARVERYQSAVKESENAVQTLVDALARANADLGSAEGELAGAATHNEKREQWFTAVAEEPLVSVAAAATAVLDGVLNDALTKIDDETSAAFMERVTLRLSNHWDRVADLDVKSTNLEAGWDVNAIAHHGYQANIDIKRGRFLSAIRDLENFIGNAVATVDSGRSLAQTVVDGEVLSAAQKARIAALLATGDVVADVLGPESDFLAAEHDLILRQRELDAARATVKAGDPDISEADLNDHADVRAILEGTDGKDALGDMQSAYDDAFDALGKPAFEDVIAKERALEDALQALAQATAEFLEENPEADPEAEASLDDERDEVDDKRSELNDARDLVKTKPWYKLEELETAVPDSAWRDIAGLIKAKRNLTKIKDTVPNDLKNALIDAEDELVVAMRQRDDSADGFAILSGQIEKLRSVSALVAARGLQTDLGVVRGLD